MNIIIAKKPEPLQEDWRKWFAWHPVITDSDNGACYLVWLEPVERKQCAHYAGAMWRYRVIINQGELNA